MIPYELVLRNFMCYRDGLPPLKLDGLHIACLSGENGAGKSALLDAITWALWGKARMSDDELIAQGESEMLVDLSFQLNGQRYRVIRQRRRARSGSRSGGKSLLELQVQSEMGWRPIGDGKITETEKLIEDLLHMNYETFINASFLLQGRADEFTRKTPGERKQVLADILDLREYATLEERARRRVKHLHDQIVGLDGIIGHLQQEADKLDCYTQLVDEAAIRVGELSTALAAAEEAQRAADAQVAQLEGKQERRKQVTGELAELRSEQGRQEQEIAGLRVQIGESEALLQRQDEIHAGMRALIAARNELKRLEALRPRFDELREQRRQYQDQLKDELWTLHRELDRQQQAIEDLATRAARRPEVQAALRELEQRLATLDPRAEELRAVREQIDDCDARISRANDLLRQRSDCVKQIEMRQDSLVAAREEQQRTIERREHDLGEVSRWRSDLAAAQAQQQALHGITTRLDALRERERIATERAGELRALCAQFKQQADQLKQDRDRLSETDATVCPVCRSELGHTGVSRVMEHYDQEIADLRERYRACRQEAKALETELAQIRAQVGDLEREAVQAQSAAARVDALQQQLAIAGQWQTELDQAQRKLADIQRQLDAEDYEREARAALQTVEAELIDLGATGEARDRPARAPRTKSTPDPWAAVLDSLARERAELQQKRAGLERQLETRADITGQVEVHRRDLADAEQATVALPEARQSLATLQDTIERGDFAHEIRMAGRAVEAEIAALGYSDEAHNAARAEVDRLAHWDDEERRLREAQIRLESDRRMLQQASELHQRRAADIERLTREDALLEQDLRALPAARQQAQACAQEVEARRRELEVVRRDLHDKQFLRDKAQEAATQLVQKRAERRALAERQGVFQDLVEAFGKKGVQAMLIETAIPEIERESNRLLSRMTDNQMHVTFEMQRDTRKGDTVETLEIKIADALGTRTYDAFSGGEAMRVNFAIRVALSRLLARRAGASLETLVIDEGFGTLDAQGRERFVEAITGVQQDFKRILVITHLEELKERFPAQIEITKTPSGSVWTLL